MCVSSVFSQEVTQRHKGRQLFRVVAGKTICWWEASRYSRRPGTDAWWLVWKILSVILGMDITLHYCQFMWERGEEGNSSIQQYYRTSLLHSQELAIEGYKVFRKQMSYEPESWYFESCVWYELKKITLAFYPKSSVQSATWAQQVSLNLRGHCVGITTRCCICKALNTQRCYLSVKYYYNSWGFLTVFSEWFGCHIWG